MLSEGCNKSQEKHDPPICREGLHQTSAEPFVDEKLSELFRGIIEVHFHDNNLLLAHCQ